MKVFIAEKPSMARELAKCLPPPLTRGNGYIRTGGGIVTWAYGHVLQQAEPEAYDPKYKQWNEADLPIIPKEWKLLVSPGSAEQFKVICSLIDQADTIVNAGDPDREGQLLIDEILDYVGNTKPVERILLNALDEKSIRESLAHIRDNHDFVHLKESALARSRADWLIGMNLSRAYTLAARRQGHRVVFPIGRVKTPTLALVVRRERELENFKPVTYYVVKAVFDHAKGPIAAQWQPQDTARGLDAEGRCIDEAAAKDILRKLEANPNGTIAEQKKGKKREPQRLPLSLSALQVLAGKRYGYSPQQVLDTAQRLYERKLTTYPRSDCEYLPLNQRRDVPVILKNLAAIPAGKLAAWAEGADPNIKSRAWNDGKITAHHAIIPTTVPCPFTKLSSMEQHVYYLIAQAYLAQFYPIHEYNQTKITVSCAGEAFAAHGKTVTEIGWKALYQQDAKEEEDAKRELPVVRKGDAVQYRDGSAETKATKPPPRFTAATLLAAMKEIYKYVKDESLKKTLKDVQGIGTEATRATIINELITRKFLAEEGKKKILKPTETAYLLVDFLPDDMLYPDETAVWETRLNQMSAGKDGLASFLHDQCGFLARLVSAAAAMVFHGHSGKVCPKCGSHMVKRHGKYGDFYGCTKYPSCRYTEPLEGKEQPAGDNAASAYPCPRCKTGHFIRKKGPYGFFWVCSTARCNTTCADVDGVPSVYRGK